MKQLPKYLTEMDGSLWLTEDDRDNLKISYRIKEVLFEETSPFQHVMILDSYDFGPMLVLDGVVQTTSMDGHIYNEMISHVPLTLHGQPRNVLIIGGGDCGAAKEVAKYDSVERIDLVEIDEAVVRSSREHMPEVSGRLSDPRVSFIYEDGVKFVEQKENEYDCIIVDSSDPVGPAEALFGKEFYQSVHRALREDGLMVCQSESPIFYADVMVRTYQRISSLFPVSSLYTAVVPTYPGGLWSFTIGSKKALPDPASLRFDKTARYVNEQVLRSCFALPAFLQGMLQRSEGSAVAEDRP